MVQLHVKRGDESQFLYSTTVDAPLETVIQQVTAIYNGRLKVDRLCSGETQDIHSCSLCTRLSVGMMRGFGRLHSHLIV